MYETPKLNRVGKATEVILGFVSSGDDVDTHYFIENFEYADDGSEE